MEAAPTLWFDGEWKIFRHHRREEPSMGSILRRVRKRKRCFGEVQVLRREEYEGMDLDAKVEADQRQPFFPLATTISPVPLG